jgi:hypothetical protein
MPYCHISYFSFFCLSQSFSWKERLERWNDGNTPTTINWALARQPPKNLIQPTNTCTFDGRYVVIGVCYIVTITVSRTEIERIKRKWFILVVCHFSCQSVSLKMHHKQFGKIVNNVCWFSAKLFFWIIKFASNSFWTLKEARLKL